MVSLIFGMATISALIPEVSVFTGAAAAGAAVVGAGAGGAAGAAAPERRAA